MDFQMFDHRLTSIVFTVPLRSTRKKLPPPEGIARYTQELIDVLIA